MTRRVGRHASLEALIDDPSERCAGCARLLRHRFRRCPSCGATVDERANDTLPAFSPTLHHVQIACLTCARTASLADARASAGRCRFCGGTLVVGEVG